MHILHRDRDKDRERGRERGDYAKLIKEYATVTMAGFKDGLQMRLNYMRRHYKCDMLSSYY